MKLFIYCAGSFGKEIMDVAKRINNRENRWDEICFIDDSPQGDEFYGAKLFNFPTALDKFDLTSLEISIANGEPAIKKALYDRVNHAGAKLATLIDHTAIVSPTAKLGTGVTVSAYCFISSSAVLGDNTILNTNALVGHDTILGENCVLSSAVNIGGNCSIGESTYVGMGAQVKQGTVVGKEVIVGMGSIVHNDIQDGMIALGNPARPMRRNTDKKVFK